MFGVQVKVVRADFSKYSPTFLFGVLDELQGFGRGDVTEVEFTAGLFLQKEGRANRRDFNFCSTNDTVVGDGCVFTLRAVSFQISLHQLFVFGVDRNHKSNLSAPLEDFPEHSGVANQKVSR